MLHGKEVKVIPLRAQVLSKPLCSKLWSVLLLYVGFLLVYFGRLLRVWVIDFGNDLDNGLFAL